MWCWLVCVCVCQVVYLRRWPLLRDCVFYTFSIILLVVAIMDEAIYWYVTSSLSAIVHGTEWPVLCSCVVKQLHTHSAALPAGMLLITMLQLHQRFMKFSTANFWKIFAWNYSEKCRYFSRNFRKNSAGNFRKFTNSQP